MTDSELTAIHEIEVAAGSKENIDGSKMKAWMSNPSIEVLGALIEHILPLARRTDPPPSMEEMCRTVQNYYRQSLIQNVKEVTMPPTGTSVGTSLLPGSNFSGVTRLPRVTVLCA